MGVSGERTIANWGVMLNALTDEHRRRLLVALLDHNPQEDTVEVPEGVHVGETELETLQMKMFHNHLPMLEEAGFIKRHREGHEVVKGPKFDEIRSLLALIHTHRDELPEGWV